MKHFKDNVQFPILSDKDEEKVRPFAAFEQTLVSKLVCFYLNGEIGDPMNYAEMVHRIRSASPTDVIEIHLNTPGGRIDTGMQIINAIETTQAHVVTILDSRAFSLGTLIFLAGDEMQVHDNCMMMFHNFSSGMQGKANEQAVELDAMLKWFEKLMKKFCAPFLSTQEINRLLKGEDIWMDSDEIRARLMKVFANPQKPKTRKAKAKQSSK